MAEMPGEARRPSERLCRPRLSCWLREIEHCYSSSTCAALLGVPPPRAALPMLGCACQRSSGGRLRHHTCAVGRLREFISCCTAAESGLSNSPELHGSQLRAQPMQPRTSAQTRVRTHATCTGARPNLGRPKLAMRLSNTINPRGFPNLPP